VYPEDFARAVACEACGIPYGPVAVGGPSGAPGNAIKDLWSYEMLSPTSRGSDVFADRAAVRAAREQQQGRRMAGLSEPGFVGLLDWDDCCIEDVVHRLFRVDSSTRW
jgi:hypothetical protein